MEGNLLYIKDVFSSIQGEGLFVGLPSIFIRFSGCNLRCSWCDEPSAIKRNVEGKTIFEVKEMLADLDKPNKIGGHVNRDIVHLLVLTGGEPMIAEGWDGLAIRAGKTWPGRIIVLETNGSVPPTEKQLVDTWWYSVSPKNKTFNLDKWKNVENMYLKLIAETSMERFNFAILKKMVQLKAPWPVFIQPCDSRAGIGPTGEDLRIAQELFWNVVASYPSLDIRMGGQFHKYWRMK